MADEFRLSKGYKYTMAADGTLSGETRLQNSTSSTVSMSVSPSTASVFCANFVGKEYDTVTKGTLIVSLPFGPVTGSPISVKVYLVRSPDFEKYNRLGDGRNLKEYIPDGTIPFQSFELPVSGSDSVRALFLSTGQQYEISFGQGLLVVVCEYGATGTTSIKYQSSSGDKIGTYTGNIPFEKEAPVIGKISPPSGTFVPTDTVDLEIKALLNENNGIGYLYLRKMVFQQDMLDGTISEFDLMINGEDVQFGKLTTKWHAFVITNFKNERNPLKFRIKFVTVAGQESQWSPWITWIVKDGATNATPISPVQSYISRGDQKRFTWDGGGPLGAAVTKSELQYAIETDPQGEWNTLGSVEGPETYLDVDASVFPLGTVYWRVRSYDASGVAGNWSDPAEVIVTGQTVAPTITSVTAAPRPSITWEADGQISYQIVVEGKLDTGEIAGDQREYQILTYWESGQYPIKIRVRGNNGTWSDWTETVMTVENAVIAPPTVSFTPEQTRLKITVSDKNRFYKVYLLRDGVPIAKMTGDSYYDYGALGKMTYTIRGVDSADNWADATAVVQYDIVSGAVFAPASRIDQPIWMRHQLDQRFASSTERSPMGEYVYYSGREKPVFVWGEGYTETVTTGVGTFDGTLAEQLRQIAQSKETVLYRDSMGVKRYGVIDSIAEARSKIGGRMQYRFSISLRVVDFDESIPFDPPAAQQEGGVLLADAHTGG